MKLLLAISLLMTSFGLAATLIDVPYGDHFRQTMDVWMAKSEELILCTKDDKQPVKGEPQTDPTHSAVLGLMLQDTLKPLGEKCEVLHPLNIKPAITMQELLSQAINTEKQ